MSFAQTVAWIALAYLILPLLAYLVYIVAKRLRGGGKDEVDGES